jgi:hypothetical protein
MNHLIGIFPLLFGISSCPDMSKRCLFAKKNIGKILAVFLFMIAVWIPQSFYWHHITGDWLLYSYKDEGFNFWNRPQVLKVLFSPLNGWLIYNPAMVFAIIGLYLLRKGNQYNSWGTGAVFLLSTYLFGSWWCWWFGGAFGLRSYIDILPLLAIPLCYLIRQVMLSKN